MGTIPADVLARPLPPTRFPEDDGGSRMTRVARLWKSNSRHRRVGAVQSAPIMGRKSTKKMNRERIPRTLAIRNDRGVFSIPSSSAAVFETDGRLMVFLSGMQWSRLSIAAVISSRFTEYAITGENRLPRLQVCSREEPGLSRRLPARA